MPFFICVMAYVAFSSAALGGGGGDVMGALIATPAINERRRMNFIAILERLLHLANVVIFSLLVEFRI